MIHIRPGAASNDLRKLITERLHADHGYQILDVNALMRDENERKTELGIEINSRVSASKMVTSEMNVRMLKNIIYSGDTSKTKFIL